EVQPHHHGTGIGEIEEVERFALPGRGWRGLGWGPHRADQGEEDGEWAQARDHDSTSLIGAAFGSTRRIGRPTLDSFCLAGSRPTALQTVASRSGTPTGCSFTSMPSGLVLPIASPPLIPPPARTVLHELAQWSRPLRSATIFGVRPNSPIQTMVVVSSSPRSWRSSRRAAQAGSRTPHSFFTLPKVCSRVSQPIPLFTPGAEDKVTSTNGTPRSMSRRASRQPWPNRLRPYLSRRARFF